MGEKHDVSRRGHLHSMQGLHIKCWTSIMLCTILVMDGCDKDKLVLLMNPLQGVDFAELTSVIEQCMCGVLLEFGEGRCTGFSTGERHMIVKHRVVSNLRRHGTDENNCTDAHTQTHKETLNYKHTHHELSPTHAPQESFVISYAQKMCQYWGDFMSFQDATASSHVRSVSTSDHILHPFPLVLIHSLKLLFHLCKCPTWTKEGSTATQGDNKKIHDNSSQGRGEKREIYIPINQSINYTT